MFERIAALDLGTNTFHLLIAEISDDQILRVIVTEQRHVKLGEGGITDGIITPTAFNRGITALQEFAAIIANSGDSTVRAVGTAALRSAKNGQDFINQAKLKAGITINLIDGDTEALLIYKGVKQAVDITTPVLIMDVGGGSVEFILADENGLKWKKSYPVGAARLMALFYNSDPVSDDDQERLLSYITQSLADLHLPLSKFKPQKLIGSAGAFETYAAMVISRFQSGNPTLSSKYFRFETKQLLEVINDLIKSTHQERACNTDILPVRVDMIVMAALLTKYVIEAFDIKQTELSIYALKEGLLVSS